jgi:xylitol oxidase
MSTAFQLDSVGFHFTWKKSNFDPEVVRNIENHLKPFNYRPHWGKMFYADSQYLSSVYPMMKKFLALTAEIDPRGKFTNAFTDALIAGKLTLQ